MLINQKANKKNLSLFPPPSLHPKVLILNQPPCFGSPSLFFEQLAIMQIVYQKKKSHKKQHLNSEQFKEITLAEEAKDLLSKENPWFF